MNRRQKLIQAQFLNNEEAVIKRLKQVYGQALKDIDGKIEKLMERFDPVTGDLPQSAVYQLKYQKMLKAQVEGILKELQTRQYLTVSGYLDRCYEDGFIGGIFDLHGQGIPLTMPLDQEAMIRAVQLESKISQGLYTRLGEDVDLLRKKITAQVSRSIANGTSFEECARQLAGYSRIGYNNAIRIARTEGHRIQVTGTMDAMYQAKDRGADVVKQWDATLDGETRESHVAVDGEIRELDEPFSNGLMFPGDPAGGAAEVVNCRCALLQRARWALDDDELETLKKRAEFFGLDKSGQFDDFRKKYLKAVEPVKTPVKTPFTPAKTLEEAEAFARQFGVAADYSKYNLDVANAVNETMFDIQNIFGTTSLDHLHQIGTFPKGFSTRYKGVYVWRGNDDIPTGSLWLRNVNGKNALEKMASVAREQYDLGYWSTAEALHTIRHELGHAIHRALGTPEINAQISALWKSIQDERLRRNMSGDRNHKYSDWLSEYGMTNPAEFVADCIAEYLAGNPRETAKRLVEILTGGV